MPRDYWPKLPYKEKFLPFDEYRQLQAIQLASMMDPEALEKTVVVRSNAETPEQRGERADRQSIADMLAMPRYTVNRFTGKQRDNLPFINALKKKMALERQRQYMARRNQEIAAAAEQAGAQLVVRNDAIRSGWLPKSLKWANVGTAWKGDRSNWLDRRR